jgi:hypothetical protein
LPLFHWGVGRDEGLNFHGFSHSVVCFLLVV